MGPPLLRRELFGLRFVDAPDLGPITQALLDHSGDDPAINETTSVVVTPNVDLLVRLDKDECPVASSVIRRASYVLADGQPVVWASRLLGQPLVCRLAGSSLVADLWPHLVRERRSVLVVAANEELRQLIVDEYPKARVVVPPHFQATDPIAIDALMAECIELCAGEPPEYVFLGLSYPKQYLVIDAMLARWPQDERPRYMLAIGGSFEMYYGLRKRAPQWIQRAGMEWLYRFVQEPRRLFRRYFIDDTAFVAIVWRARRSSPKSLRPRPRA